MPSMQDSVGASKASKFTGVENMFDPMKNPFDTSNGSLEDMQDLHDVLSQQADMRVKKALNDVNGHSNAAYYEPGHDSHYNAMQQQKQPVGHENHIQPVARENESIVSRTNPAQLTSVVNDDEEEEDDYDYLLDDDDDDDPVLEALRQKRMEEIRRAQAKHAENVAKGHGECRTISQDEFLSECNTDDPEEHVVIHFFHNEFERCKIMDHHLKIVATQHFECKVLRIDVEKAPFFVQKLQVRVLPTVLVFCQGKVVNRLTGFEGLVPEAASASSSTDTWKTPRLQEWLAKAGAIQYTPNSNSDDEEEKPKTKGSIRSSVSRHYRYDHEEH